ncbi:uncharacterized protein A4U43_C04F14460 [Asparagus officinalis]|uniref:Exocyst subunit Exo70 family protein n=2 Tax=Asparagus officinalis TaxID=4686 RepID=A0A5P1F0V1_ASPOF|nr:uncharacterized protein A4U43_C04F14460 [Asparagus officinalis]
MSRLEEEFRHIMIRNTVPLDAAGLHSSIRRLSLSFASDAGENEHLDEEFDISNEAESSVDSSSHHHHRRQESERSERFGSLSEVDLIRPEAVADLKDIADRMIRSDYSKELSQVYSSVRREILDECLSVLGVDRMSIDEVQRIEWKTLDDKMRKWIQAVKVVVRVLLSGERRLCDEIFSESDELKEECFVESTKGCIMQLLNFGDAVAIQRRSSEKLFRILDMYEALSEVKPSLDELFAGDLGAYIIKETERILEWLGDAVRGTLAEFTNAVQKETSKKTMQGGEIHPLVRYVMNYVKLLVDYSNLLESLLDDSGFESEDVGSCDESKTRLGHWLRLLISYLESNLEEKSKFYEDAALQFIFLMNNRLYIVQKVKDSDLGKILGEDWVRRRRGQIRQYHNSYIRASWTKALSFLKDDGLGGSGSASSVSKVALKERFKSFNLAFEEIYRTQTTWKVPDPQLREELQVSTAERIIPAYRSFLGRFGGQLETSRHAAKYIKYTPEDLEAQLLEFFEGSSGLSNHPRRKLSSS